MKGNPVFFSHSKNKSIKNLFKKSPQLGIFKVGKNCVPKIPNFHPEISLNKAIPIKPMSDYSHQDHFQSTRKHS